MAAESMALVVQACNAEITTVSRWHLVLNLNKKRKKLLWVIMWFILYNNLSKLTMFHFSLYFRKWIS